MHKTITYKHSKDIEVFFTPLECGRCRYHVEVHDYANLEGVKAVVEYMQLERILRRPLDFIKKHRMTRRVI